MTGLRATLGRLAVAALLLGALPASAQEAPPLDLDQLAHAVHAEVNRVRAASGRPPLAWDDALARLAGDHSRDMGRRGFFAHVNPDGEDPTERGRRGGVTCETTDEAGRVWTGISENLFTTTRYDSVFTTVRGTVRTTRYDWKTPAEIAREAVDAWMSSPPHRRNLLDPRLRREGLGLSGGRDHALYVTQNLC